jgi:cytochrome P450
MNYKSSAEQEHPLAWSAFGAGGRSCIGQAMGMLSLQVGPTCM